MEERVPPEALGLDDAARLLDLMAAADHHPFPALPSGKRMRVSDSQKTSCNMRPRDHLCDSQGMPAVGRPCCRSGKQSVAPTNVSVSHHPGPAWPGRCRATALNAEGLLAALPAWPPGFPVTGSPGRLAAWILASFGKPSACTSLAAVFNVAVALAHAGVSLHSHVCRARSDQTHHRSDAYYA